MKTIEIQYFGSIRAAAKKIREEADFIPGITVYDMLRRLACANEKDFRDEIFGDGGKDLRDDLTVTVNGAAINRENAPGIILNPGDSLALFPIFPGGG